MSIPIEEKALLYFISACLVLFSGIMSGLTTAFMSIDTLDMELSLITGSRQQKQAAQKVLKVINNHHLLLVTLLLADAVCMETLPLFLDELMHTMLAIIVSVTAVLVFGEILPQALCTGNNQIKIASRMVPLVQVVMIVLYPISKPISMLLDKLFGNRTKKRYNKQELKALIRMHYQQLQLQRVQEDRQVISDASRSYKTSISLHTVQDSFYEEIKEDQVQQPLLKNISFAEVGLDLDTCIVKDIYIEIHNVQCIHLEEKIDEEIMQKLYRFSRVPVLDKGRCVGILKVKSLVAQWVDLKPQYSYTAFKDIPNLYIEPPSVVDCNSSLTHALYSYIRQNIKMQIVQAEYDDQDRQPKSQSAVLGICTITDLLRKLQCEKNKDERDTHENEGEQSQSEIVFET